MPTFASRCKVTFPALIIPFLASLIYFVWLAGDPLAKWAYTGAKIFTLIWPWFAVYYILRSRSDYSSHARPTGKLRDEIKLGVLFGSIIAGAIFLFMASPLGSVVHSAKPLILQKVQDLGILNHYWWFAIFLSVIHSWIEEIYWRWFAYGQLRKIIYEPWAHGVAAVAFAAHHVVVLNQFFPLFWALFFGSLVAVGGAIWSVLYMTRHSIVASWISHMIADFAILTVGYQVLY
jgi:membrane protease YdiL (CAAX protease family)